jgi:thiol-disulfide isomerase/thioredoxin
MRLDGQPIDWAAYRGKVVLIDFWATWCDACIREMPNILKNYALYHDRGFEVIGISSDEKREEVIALMASRKIPWAMAMASDFRGTGREMSLPDYYGITLYPTTILVDKEGKVVSLQARGPELGRQLEQLLGPPGEKEKKEVEKKEEGKQD